jgi:hypothetical protein
VGTIGCSLFAKLLPSGAIQSADSFRPWCAPMLSTEA